MRLPGTGTQVAHEPVEQHHHAVEQEGITMMVDLRLRWEAVDEGQVHLLGTSLNSGQLAPLGCLSWYSRRTPTGLWVSALWEHHYAAQIFCLGRLVEVVRAVGLTEPEISWVALRGFYATRRQPARPAASAAPAPIPPPRSREGGLVRLAPGRAELAPPPEDAGRAGTPDAPGLAPRARDPQGGRRTA